MIQRLEPNTRSCPCPLSVTHQLTAVGKPSSLRPSCSVGKAELRDARQLRHFSLVPASIGRSEPFTEVKHQHCSHRGENVAPFLRRRKTWPLPLDRHLLRKEGITASRGFSVWGGSNPRALHSCSHADVQLKASSLGPAESGSLIYLVKALHLGWLNVQQSLHKTQNSSEMGTELHN